MSRMDLPGTAKAVCLIGLGVAADQWTKRWAEGALRERAMDIVPQALKLEYAENYNAAFGLGQGLPESAKLYILLALTIGLSIGLFVAMLRAEDAASRWGFGITVAGALGNIVDRLTLGHVRDFILLFHGSWRWPNFNLADTLVCIGVGVLLVFGGRHPRQDGEKVRGEGKRAA
jgi:signal peptidase II